MRPKVVATLCAALIASAASAAPRGPVAAREGSPFDVAGTITQDLVTKLLAAVPYPFTVFEHRADFQGRAAGGGSPGTNDGDRTLTQAELEKLFAAASAAAARGAPRNAGQEGRDLPAPKAEDFVAAAVADAGVEYLDDARQLLAANADKAGTPEYADLKRIVDGGVANLASVRGIQFRIHLAYLGVSIPSRPAIALGAPTVAVADLDARVSFRVESWWYHPVIRWGWPPKVEWRWDRVVSLGLDGVRFDAAADVIFTELQPTGIQARADCKRLRLDYPLIRELPLEPIANRFLAGMVKLVYDANALVLTVPLIGSTFGVDRVQLVPGTGQLGVQVTVAQRKPAAKEAGLSKR